jgi:hypothetical protein
MKITEQNLRRMGYEDYKPTPRYNGSDMYLGKGLCLGFVTVMLGNSDSDTSKISLDSLFYRTRFRAAADSSDYVKFLNKQLEEQKRKIRNEPGNFSLAKGAEVIEEAIKEFESYPLGP